MEKAGQKNDINPSKGFLFGRQLICELRCKNEDYLAVLDVDFVAGGKPGVVVFEPNHLQRKNDLTRGED